MRKIFKTLLSADKKFIGAKPKLLGIITQDGRIRDCVINKTSVFERYPVCQSAKAIQSMAQRIINGDDNVF